MKLRLIALAVLLSSAPALAKTVSITGVAQDQSGASKPTAQTLSTPAGETGEIDISVTHPDGTAYDLTGCNLTLSVGSGGSKISRQATIVSAAAGTAKFPLVIADTLNLLGTYSYDVTLTIADGSFYRVVPASSFVVTSGLGQPGQAVTVPASQQPLAQGPAGPAGATGNPQTIENSGSALTSRSTLNFTGAGISCVDNAGASRTDCTVSGGGTVSSVSNSDSTLIVSPTSGAVVTSLNLAHANTFSMSQNVASVALTDGATISTDASLGNSFGVTIAGNRTIANPTNLVSGGTYQWEIVQDATGSRTITWDTLFTWPGGSAPTLLTAAGAKDLISCYYDGTSLLCGSLAGSSGGGGGSGTVTSITAGTGLTGGTITTSGTIALDLAHANTFSMSQNVASVALTDGATISTDASLGNAFTVTLGGNRTLANPTNLVAGGVYQFLITQDATGSRTLTYGTAFKWPGGTAPTLTTTASAVDLISCLYNGTILACVFQGNFS